MTLDRYAAKVQGLVDVGKIEGFYIQDKLSHWETMAIRWDGRVIIHIW